MDQIEENKKGTRTLIQNLTINQFLKSKGIIDEIKELKKALDEIFESLVLK